MKKLITRYSHIGKLSIALLLGLAVVACDNSVNISPTEPRMPDLPRTVGALRTLQISGILAAEKGSCERATILFNGEEIDGARSRCHQAQGCNQLQLGGVVSAPAGHHTITFQVLSQSAKTDDYLASAIVEVSRVDIELFEPVVLELEPVRATLQAGEGVSFTFDLRD